MIKLFKLERVKELIKIIGHFLTDEELDEILMILEKAINRIYSEENTYLN